MAQSKSYNELSDELKQVMERLEDGELDIDEAVSSYERGLMIVKELEAHLQAAENKVTQLKAAVIAEEEE